MDVTEMLGDFSVNEEKPSCLMDMSMPQQAPPVVKQALSSRNLLNPDIRKSEPRKLPTEQHLLGKNA